MISYKLNIHLFDLEGTQLKDRLEAECPELLPDEGNYQICIHEGDIFGSTMQRELDALGQVDYCVSALGDDETSIRAAVWMRRHFCAKAGYTKPFICAYVQSSAKKMAVSELSENTRRKTSLSYDIVPFGGGGAYYGNESDAAFVLEYLGLGVQSHYFPSEPGNPMQSPDGMQCRIFMKSRAIADRV